jgi:putative intracellular protease/amidase
MKRLIVTALILVVGFSLYGNGNKEKVLLYIRHGTPIFDTDFIAQEVGPMISMLKHAGFKVVVASASGAPIEGKSRTLEPDLRLSDVRVDDYVGVIMPCCCRGTAQGGWHASPEEVSLVNEALSMGKPVAAQDHSTVILAEAGVLVGRKYANWEDESGQDACFEGAVYSGDGVVRDGKIITSAYCPFTAHTYKEQDGTPQLVTLFIEAIKD